jgi:ribosomal protein S18 acetylase RimI-like enzyme
MVYEIRPIAEEHIPSFHATLDAVAREHKFLSFLEARSVEQMRDFVLNNIKEGWPQFVVLADEEIVGWCDVLPNSRRTVSAHCATLGMGLLPKYRGQGIGRKLMQRALDAAFAFGFTRIELTVRQANVNAIALYRNFVRDGRPAPKSNLHRGALREHAFDGSCDAAIDNHVEAHCGFFVVAR